jgi:hypothetical protein
VEAKTVIKTIISKCMTSDKEEIKSSCEQILFWYMDNRYEELLLNELNEELLNKNPKVFPALPRSSPSASSSPPPSSTTTVSSA